MKDRTIGEDSMIGVYAVVLLVGVTLIVSASVGVTALGFLGLLGEPAVAGVTVDAHDGDFTMTVVDQGNLDAFFVTTPRGTRSISVGGAGLGSGTRIVFDSGGVDAVVFDPRDVDDNTTDLYDVRRIHASELPEMPGYGAQDECVVRHSGFYLQDGTPVPPNVALPCHAPTLFALKHAGVVEHDAFEDGTLGYVSAERAEFGPVPLFHDEGVYSVVGVVDGEPTVVRTYTVD